MNAGPMEVLPPALAGNYAYVNACLWPSPGPGGGMFGVELVESRLGEVVGRFAALHPGCDRRPVVSMWFQIYVAALLPPLVAADRFAGVALPVGLDEVRVLLGEDGICTGFVLLPGGPVRGDAFHRFAPVLFDHVEPLIEALAVGMRISRRLLWANVADSLHAIAAVAEHLPGAVPEAAADIDRLLTARLWPDGRRNPLAGHTRYLPTDHEHRERARRVCCLRHMLPDFETCPACPAPEEPPR